MDPKDEASYLDFVRGQLSCLPEGALDEFWKEAVAELPNYLRGLISLGRNTDLPASCRRVVHRVIKYIVSPLDLRPELIYGPSGYTDDLVLAALAVKVLSDSVGREVMAAHGLVPGDPTLGRVRRRAGEALDAETIADLQGLLAADAVPGDEDLEDPNTTPADLTSAADTDATGDGRRRIVFAGPGTGKTHRIESELMRLLTEEHADPASILVTTFTNKAADELRVRTRRRLLQSPGAGDPDRVLQKLRISTIHALCHSLIAEYRHHLLFLKGTFAPLEPNLQLLLLFRLGYDALPLQEIYYDWKDERPFSRESNHRPVGLFPFYRDVATVYAFLSEEALGGTAAWPGTGDADGTRELLRQRYIGIVHQDDPESVLDRIIATYPAYWKQVVDEGYLDHSMVLAYTEALLDDPQIRRRVQARYRYVLVDEYQDTNPIQDRIFRAIAGRTGTFFCVADDDQSIYAFRGADVRNAVRFTERWPGSTIETLEVNRRTTKNLVSAASKLTGNNSERVPKKLRTDNPRGTPPWRLEAPKEELPAQLAKLLARLKKGKAFRRLSDVAILFRTSKPMHKYQLALDDEGIPAVLGVDRKFLKKPVVKGLLGVLYMIRGEASKITNRTRRHRPFFEAMGIEDRGAMLDWLRRWHASVAEDAPTSVLDLYYTILNDVGAIEKPELLSDLGRLSAFLAEAEEQIRSRALSKRLDWILSYSQQADADAPALDGSDAVSILTIHAAKGCEFDIVVIADVIEGELPCAWFEDVRSRLLRELTDEDASLDPIEEERRVFYVGVTRARRLLIVTTDPECPSPFLAEGELPTVPVTERRIRAFLASHPRRAPSIRKPPPHFSHSQIYNYTFCPKRFYLADRCGFAGQVIAPVRAGLSLHRSLEVFHRMLREGETVDDDRIERIFDRCYVIPRDKRAAKKERERLLSIFHTYVAGFRRGVGRASVAGVEQPFYVTMEDGVLAGKIDLLRLRSQRIQIIELKFQENTRLPDYPKRQLGHYSLAFAGDDPELFVHYLKENRKLKIARKPPDEIRSQLAAGFEKIRRGRLEPHPGRSRCRVCPVRRACAETAAPR